MATEKRLIDANALAKNGWHLVKTGESNQFLASMSLADVPTVDAVEVVHGRWIVNNKEAICSACKFTTFEWAEWTFNYCPNCGARMDLEV